MPNRHATPCHHRDVSISHPQGRLFARVWEPQSGSRQSTPRSPIVLLHDSLGCIDLWRHFPAELCAATGHPVIAYDRLGFGRSDARQALPSLDFIADEARSYFPLLRAQLGFDRFIAFGHSVGGGMAVNCAAEFAAHCDALITESAQAFPEDLTLASIVDAKAQFAESGQLDRLRKYHGDKAEWVLKAWTDSWLHPDFAAWTLAPVLPQVTCPVLAIHGEHDEYGSARHPEMIAGLCSGPSRCEILPATGHVPHRERGALVLDLVREFIASLSGQDDDGPAPRAHQASRPVTSPSCHA